MKIFFDTNILISSILFPNSIPDLVIQKALINNDDIYTSDYCIDELRHVFSIKFPNKIDALESFLYVFYSSVKIVITNNTSYIIESEIRDPKDRPVLRAALQCNADILITGDKDLLDANTIHPKIIKAIDYYKYNDGTI